MAARGANTELLSDLSLRTCSLWFTGFSQGFIVHLQGNGLIMGKCSWTSGLGAGNSSWMSPIRWYFHVLTEELSKLAVKTDHSFEFLNSPSWFFFHSFCGLTLNNWFTISFLAGRPRLHHQLLYSANDCRVWRERLTSLHLRPPQSWNALGPRNRCHGCVPAPPSQSCADLSFRVKKLAVTLHNGLIFWYWNIRAQSYDAMSQWASPPSLLWKQTPRAPGRGAEIDLQCCRRFKTHIVGL